MENHNITLTKVLNSLGFRINPVQGSLIIELTDLTKEKGEEISMAEINAVVNKYLQVAPEGITPDGTTQHIG